MKHLFKTLAVTLFVLIASTAYAQTDDELITEALKTKNPNLEFVKKDLQKGTEATFDVTAIDIKPNPVKVYTAVVTIKTETKESFEEEVITDGAVSTTPHYVKVTKAIKTVVFNEEPTEVNSKKQKEPKVEKVEKVEKEVTDQDLIKDALAEKNMKLVEATPIFLSKSTYNVIAADLSTKTLYSAKIEIQTKSEKEYKRIGDTKSFEEVVISKKSVVFSTKLEQFKSSNSEQEQSTIVSYSTTGRSSLVLTVKDGEVINMELAGWPLTSKIISIKNKTVSIPDPDKKGSFLTVEINFIPGKDYKQYDYKEITK